MGSATSVAIQEEQRHQHTPSVHIGAHNREVKTRMNYMLPDNSLHGNFKYFAMLFKNDLSPYENVIDMEYLKTAMKKYGFQDKLLDGAAAKCQAYDNNEVDIDEYMENMRLCQKKLLLELFAPNDVDPTEVIREIKLLCPLVEEHELESRVASYFKHSAVARKLKVKEHLSKHKPGILTAEEVESSDGEIQSMPDEEVAAQRLSIVVDDDSEEDKIAAQLASLEKYDEIVDFYYEESPEGPTIDLFKVKKLAKEFAHTLGKKPVLDIELPCVVVGDIHAYWDSLIRAFGVNGHPKNTKYLFLGDYVDRGPRGVDVLLLLYSLKVKYPDNINMIRGNHEDYRVNIKYGFRKECNVIDNSGRLFPLLTRVFARLPFLAILGGHIVCTHGGIPRKVSKTEGLVDELREVQIPFADCLSKKHALNHCLGELLWNDPHDEMGWGRNLVRGPGFYEFGHDILLKYLSANGCTHLIRGHEICEVGFHIHKARRCVTLFTAANYQEKRNFAATLSLHKNGLGIFTVVN
jgi:hypothetical protein